ncbi:hypothetical protein EV643_117106 [Kribbella sp. VKM Ac-2527]|uniref:Uncharacterized protein n=1 Tax=Kribbella caucasensis TaxID=2512215 RepID=A0A4R6K406_9ACTN|nr:sensor domain-containing protein [Kribbella sp. VKM Ac-2527]TDO44083.1 hypothetical protein EV643_117106 [Kribbella sp. VKM Ac-2527]
MRAPKSLAFAAAAGLLVVGCSNEEPSGSPAPSTSTSTPSATPTPTPTPSATPSTPKPAGPQTRTAAELKKALMALADLPPGFSIESDQAAEGGDITASSKNAACAKLVALTNADTPPGSKASAIESYSGGQEGPFIDEQIDAMGTPQAVAALQNSFRSAIRSCKTLTLRVPNEGSSTVQVREVSPPQAGTTPVAVRFTATSGPLEGLELTMVTTGVADVVIALTVMGFPEDVAGATETAVTKAKKTLKTTNSGT